MFILKTKHEQEKPFLGLLNLGFREYLRHMQPIALKNKKELYCGAIEKVKSEFDSFFILIEVLNELDIFKELITDLPTPN